MMKRLVLSLVSVAAIAGLIAGGTFALFTAQTANVDNTFTAGTVTLDAAPVYTAIDIVNLAPGDADPAFGTYTVTYTGSLAAFIGVDLALTGGTPNLVTCGVDDFAVTVTGGSIAQTLNETTPSATGLLYGVLNQNGVATMNVAYAFDLDAPNACQTASATLSIGVYAVQQANNDANSDGYPDSW
ncbi:MAG: TasA family protein [Bacillota bacterium]